jgi:hypothetical protein
MGSAATPQILLLFIAVFLAEGTPGRPALLLLLLAVLSLRVLGIFALLSCIYVCIKVATVAMPFAPLSSLACVFCSRSPARQPSLGLIRTQFHTFIECSLQLFAMVAFHLAFIQSNFGSATADWQLHSR